MARRLRICPKCGARLYAKSWKYYCRSCGYSRRRHRRRKRKSTATQHFRRPRGTKVFGMKGRPSHVRYLKSRQKLLRRFTA